MLAELRSTISRVFKGGRSSQPEKRRVDLRDAAPRMIKARYDAAQQDGTHQNHWLAADAYDADSANSKAVRSTLVSRSRYEVGNNGYSDGMLQTHANYLVGVGPTLRMQTNSPVFNRKVENAWYRWTKAVKLRRKLWCMAHAKTQDGESIALIRTNPMIRDTVNLDIALIETEQCQTPRLPYNEIGYVDGIRFDEFGNPLWYDILPQHPGGQWAVFNMEPLEVPSRFVLHWYQLRRPGQHRGIPEFTSTLNVGAGSRRLRESTLTHAELIANWTLFLKTMFQPDTDDLDSVAALSSLEIPKGLMTALPNNVEPFQLKAEQPSTTYDAFMRSNISEQGRPKSMPYNVAACDSSSYNYASGRLDHQTYFGTLDVEREDGVDLVLDPLFEMWFKEAVDAYGWNQPNEPAPPHTWDWPKHPVADIKSEATAMDTRLKNGSLTIPKLYADQGLDPEDEFTKEAEFFGVTIEEQKAARWRQLFGGQSPQSTSNQDSSAVVDQVVEEMANA